MAQKLHASKTMGTPHMLPLADGSSRISKLSEGYLTIDGLAIFIERHATSIDPLFAQAYRTTYYVLWYNTR